MEHIIKGDPRQWKQAVSAVLRVYIHGGPDCQHEVDVLMTEASAEIKQFARDSGILFNPVALSHNCPAELFESPKSVQLAKKELKHCVEVSCGVSFALVSEGEEMGQSLLPLTIANEHYEYVAEHLGDAEADFRRLYVKDERHDPCVYCLRPFQSLYPQYADYTSDKQPKQLAELKGLIQRVLETLQEIGEKQLGPVAQQSFAHTAITTLVDASESSGSLVFQRNIDDIDEQSEKPGYSLYRASGSRAAAASDLFNTTRGKLEDSSATTYHINWSGDTGVDRGTEAHKEYLANLKKDFVSQMKKHVGEGAEAFSALSGDPLVMELQYHGLLCTTLSQNVHCREDFLRKIQRDVVGGSRKPRILHGARGTGKSSVMAFAALNAAPACKGVMIIRFAEHGTVRSERLLLKSICEQLSLVFVKESKLALEQAQRNAAAAAEEYNQLEESDDDLLQMIGLLKRKAKFMSKVHDTYEELVEELPWRLSMVNSRRPVMIFLDGLDHLVDPDLSWIPEQMPPNVLFVGSVTTDSPAHKKLSQRLPESLFLEIPAFAVGEGAQIFDQWLDTFEIGTTDESRGQIIDSFETASTPVHLKVAIDLAHNWTCETPDKKIQVGKMNTTQLFGALLDLLEGRYGADVVGRVLSYISSLPGGLPEADLLDILSLDDDLLSAIPWSLTSRRFPPLLLAAIKADLEHCLVERDVQQRITWCCSVLATEALARYEAKYPNLWCAVNDFYKGAWVSEPKPFNNASALVKRLKLQKQGSVLRYVSPQSFRMGGLINVVRVVNEPANLIARRQTNALTSQCLFNAEFMFSAVQGTSVHELIDLYTLAASSDLPGLQTEPLQMVLGALRLSRTTLSDDPSQFHRQLLGRLAIDDGSHKYLKSLVAQLRSASGVGPSPQLLVPKRAFLQTPCSGQAKVINTWAGAVHWVQLTPDGKQIVAWVSVSPDFESNDALCVWDVESGLLVNTIRLPNRETVDEEDEDGGQQIAMWSTTMASNGHVLTTWCTGNISVWDLTSEEALRELEVQDDVTRIDLTDDMKLLVAGCDTGAIVWDYESGKELRELKHGGEVSDVFFVDNGKTILTACSDGMARAFGSGDTATVTYQGHSKAVLSIIQVDDTVVTGSSDSTVRIWKAASGDQLHCIMAGGSISSLCPSHSKQYVACGSGGDKSDRSVRLIALGSGASLGTFQGHLKKINCVQFTPDDQQIVSASDDSTIRLWSVDDGGLQPAMVVHSGKVDSLSVAGSSALSASSIGPDVHVWSCETGGLLHTMYAPQGHYVLQHGTSLSKDGTIGVCAFSNSLVKAFSTESGTVQCEFVVGKAVMDVLMSSDGSQIIVALTNEVQIRDAKSGDIAHKFTVTPKVAQPIQELSLGPNDAFLCVTMVSDVYTLTLTGELMSSQQYEEGEELCAAIPHSDGKHVLSCTEDGEDVAFWTSDRRKGSADVPEFDIDGETSAIAPLPENMVILGQHDGTVTVWDLDSTEVCYKLTQHSDGVDCIATDDRSKNFATGSEDRTVVLWHAAADKTWTPAGRFRADSAVITIGLTEGVVVYGSDSGFVGFLNTGGLAQDPTATALDLPATPVAPAKSQTKQSKKAASSAPVAAAASESKGGCCIVS